MIVAGSDDFVGEGTVQLINVLYCLLNHRQLWGGGWFERGVGGMRGGGWFERGVGGMRGGGWFDRGVGGMRGGGWFDRGGWFEKGGVV